MLSRLPRATLTGPLDAPFRPPGHSGVAGGDRRSTASAVASLAKASRDARADSWKSSAEVPATKISTAVVAA